MIEEADAAWAHCRFLTCSVLPVRVACNCDCAFCFSKSSISALRHERTGWSDLDVGSYYRWARDRGATRLVITGGGEPLLRPDDVLYLVSEGRKVFDEVACFTNGARLTRALATALRDAGLSYLCYSRHSEDDEACRALMGEDAPRLSDFFDAAVPLRVRATCVMAQGWVDSPEAVWRYIDALRTFSVREFTFKHTYVAYEASVFGASEQNRWAAAHRVASDPFEGQGEILSRLPWGPAIRRIEEVQVCYYHEPTPTWEQQQRLCRSSNLLSDGSVYASLEDRRSRLYRLQSSREPSPKIS
jgi:cyclic pyranopterin phosphate synthase